MGKRRTYIFYPQAIDPLEQEASRRIKLNNQLGKTLIGSISRDLICVAIELALPTITKMQQPELDARINKMRRNK